MSATLAAEPHHAERRTRAVAWFTAGTMVLEIAAGWWFNSMALLADGWHMGTHAAAIGLSALAYGLARRWRQDPRFAFGPWKVEVLAAFTSAVALFAAALGIAGASFERLLNPQPIRYEEALAVATVGLLVNLVCAWLLGPHEHALGGQGHAHGPGEHHDHDPHHPADAHADLNLRSAYLHVVADAATSALAIVALAGGLWLGWRGLDPAMGLVGAVMVARWGVLLMRDTAQVLLDREMHDPLVLEIRRALDEDAPWAGRADLTEWRMWRIDRSRWACALRYRSRDPGLSAGRVRRFLARWPALQRSTIEIEMQ